MYRPPVVAYALAGVAGLALALSALPGVAAPPKPVRLAVTPQVRVALQRAYASHHRVSLKRVPRFRGAVHHARLGERSWASAAFGRLSREYFTRSTPRRPFVDLGPKPCAVPAQIRTAFGVGVKCGGTTSTTGRTTTQETTTSGSPGTCAPATYTSASPLDPSQYGVGLTEVHEAFQHYEVFGRTDSEVRNQLNQCTPVTPYWGQANYWIRYAYAYQTSDGSCSIDAVKVVIHTTAITPSWTAEPGTDADVPDRWAHFIAALTIHEQGHIDLGTQGAQKLLTDLQRIPSATTCAALDQQANGVAQADLAAASQAQADYDAQTQHGATQGAVF